MSEPYADTSKDVAHGIVELIGHGYSDENAIAWAIERHVKDSTATLLQRAEKAEAACAEMSVMLRDAKWICDHVVRMEDGGKNYIIPLAEFAREPLPVNPGSALLTEVVALRAKVKAADSLSLATENLLGALEIFTANDDAELDAITWKEVQQALATYDALPTPAGKEKSADDVAGNNRGR